MQQDNTHTLVFTTPIQIQYRAHYSFRTKDEAWTRYCQILIPIILRHQRLYEAAKRRGETTPLVPGQRLIDLRQMDFSVLAALSWTELRMLDRATNEQFNLAVPLLDE
jgi:hypothetical protein